MVGALRQPAADPSAPAGPQPRRRLADQLRARNDELLAQQEAFAAEAVRYERSRIAADLHDIVGHALSLMVVQASAGQRAVQARGGSAADVADPGADAGHRVLRVTRKGARRAKVPLALATAAALDAYLADRARRGGRSGARQLAGPLPATAGGGRLRQAHLWELVRRLARDAGIHAWDQLSPHCLRLSAITFALDAGTTLRDVQDYAGHKDPRTTRRYDHARDSLHGNAAYAVAAYLA